jgi:tetratricopeptide (TPR) repeat protein
MSSVVFIDALDSLLKVVVQEPEIVIQKQPDLSALQEDSQDSIIHSRRFQVIGRRLQKQAHNSELAPHAPSANQQRLRETDTESCASILQQGLKLACDNRAIEALAKLQQAKDLVSAFKQPTQASVSLFASASLYQAHLYLTQGLAEAASAAFQAISKCAKEYEALVTDPLLLGRMEFGLASAETEASEVKMQHYKRALELFESTECPEVTEKNDWVAVAHVKLSDAYLQVSPKNVPAAAAALQKALDHFQTQKTTRAHFHAARALYKRALIFDAEGNSIMKMAFQAAAKELWTQTVGAGGVVGRSLTLQDFDDKIAEPWFK